MKTCPPSAFTLIELLVVISIIAILASLLLGVLGRTKMAAQQTQSLANLKQWGTALNLALGENRQMLPVVGKTIETADTLAWYNQLPPYLGEKSISQMAAADYPKPGKKSVWVNPAVPVSFAAASAGQFMFCYGVNTYLTTATAPYQLNATRILHPNATVFMSEKWDAEPDLMPSAVKGFFQQGDKFTATGDTTPQSGAAANFLFCDGHVDLKKRTEFDKNFFQAQAGRFDPESNQADNIDSFFTYIPYEGAQPATAH